MSTINIPNQRMDSPYDPLAESLEQIHPFYLESVVTSERPRRSDDEKALRMLELQASGRFARSQYRVHLLLTVWVIQVKLRQVLKRTMDVVMSLIALVLAIPVFLITAAAIKLDSPGPVLFKQPRVGRWGRHFNCYKFRSMYQDAEERKAELLRINEADQVVFKIRKDPRITPVGRLIRKFSIDELPQLINVLKGEMSLVGPRPPVPYEVAQYAYDQYRRLDAIPGITGLQQVSGRSQLSFQRWVELDIQYIEQQSLGKDLKILVRTIPAVISGRGAY